MNRFPKISAYRHGFTGFWLQPDMDRNVLGYHISPGGLFKKSFKGEAGVLDVGDARIDGEQVVKMGRSLVIDLIPDKHDTRIVLYRFEIQLQAQVFEIFNTAHLEIEKIRGIMNDSL